MDKKLNGYQNVNHTFFGGLSDGNVEFIVLYDPGGGAQHTFLYLTYILSSYPRFILNTKHIKSCQNNTVLNPSFQCLVTLYFVFLT